MRRPAKAALRSSWVVVLTLTILHTAFAQLGSSANESEGKRANQLPLSGRSPQGGSVTATQSPVPGTTTSVNTINPAIQVQGPYTGSIGSTARMPFSGRLSLREAVERGLEDNLGTVGLTQAVLPILPV